MDARLVIPTAAVTLDVENGAPVQLGRGAFATVLRGRYQGRPVAVKVGAGAGFVVLLSLALCS